MPTDLHPDVVSRHEPKCILDELMTARQMAEILQMRVSTIEDYARRGLLPSLKVGRHRRFLRSQVEQAIAAMARTNGFSLSHR